MIVHVEAYFLCDLGKYLIMLSSTVTLYLQSNSDLKSQNMKYLFLKTLKFGLGKMNFSFEADLRVVLISCGKKSQTYGGIILLAFLYTMFALYSETSFP